MTLISSVNNNARGDHAQRASENSPFWWRSHHRDPTNCSRDERKKRTYQYSFCKMLQLGIDGSAACSWFESNGSVNSWQQTVRWTSAREGLATLREGFGRPPNCMASIFKSHRLILSPCHEERFRGPLWTDSLDVLISLLAFRYLLGGMNEEAFEAWIHVIAASRLPGNSATMLSNSWFRLFPKARMHWHSHQPLNVSSTTTCPSSLPNESVT